MSRSRSSRPRRFPRLAAVGGAALVALGTLTACSGLEPARDISPLREHPVTISIDSSSIGQMVLGEMYQQVLAGEGRQTFLSLENSVEAGDRLTRLNENKADLMVGCTGHMLHQLYPEKAMDISEEYVSSGDDPNAGDFSQLTYNAFVGALPGYLTVPDPSSAQGCSLADGGPELPQNIVPVFHKELFDREELKAITEAGRLLTTADLQEMAEEAERRGSVPEVVAEWVSSQPI